MEFRNITTFLQVVESGSFTKAAEVLGYTQSTVSFQISQLEEELGCALFERIGRKNVLTNRGHLLQQHALKVNASVKEMIEDFHSEEPLSGTVHIYTADSVCEKMMLLNYQEFYSCYPNIHLIFSTGSTTDLLKVLDHNEADVIFTLDNHVYRNDYIIARESSVPLRFMVGAEFPLAGQKNITMEDILNYPMILTEAGLSYRKILDEQLAKLSLEMHPVLETSRTDIIIQSVAKGIGVTFLPEFVGKPYLERGEIVYLDVEGFDPIIWKQLIYRKDKWMSKVFDAFLQFVMEHEFDW